ncbi:MAG: ATP-binding protein [Acidimicrobiales bacterium]
MSLRLRLALGLAILLVVGMAAFGLATYSFYAPTQYAQLDSQLRSSVINVSAELEQRAGIAPTRGNSGGGASGGPDGAGGPGGQGQPPPVILAYGSYAALLSPSGKVVASLDFDHREGVPRISGRLPTGGSAPRLFTTTSVNGGPQWRVLATGAAGLPGYIVVIATPTTPVTSALHHLLLVEAEVALGLLACLLIGSWLILQRGLRPLEHMAHDSRAIAAGDLSRRVGPAKGPTEVVELGTALNAMLADIEGAFAERDVTEARLRQFLADVSHELRTPLTSIQGFAELFRLSAGDSSIDATTAARRIEQEAGRMKRLVDDLLLLARLDQSPEMQREEVDLAVVVADACTAAVASERGRPINLDAPSPVLVVGDRNHLQQAVTNLLSNALKHTPPGSPIEVSVVADEREALVSVTDHGPGLDEAALEHVFDRFWRADKARAGDGAGLGLAIVAAIAAEHGGSVQAGNSAEHSGAQFTLRLPTAPRADGAKSMPARRDL